MRSLSEKGGMKRYRETQVILPMRASIAEIRTKETAKVVDFSALISSFRPKSRVKVWTNRIIKLFMLFS